MFYHKDLVAVDMGSSCIKILSFKKRGRKYHLQHQPMVESLKRGVIHQGQILDLTELKNTFNHIHSRSVHFSKLKRCALAINSGAVMIRRFDVAGGESDGDFGSKVFQTAEQLINDFSTLYWGYSVVGEGMIPGTSAVVVCAAKIEMVESYLSVIRSAGMKVGVIDTAVTCISNALNYNYNKLPGFHIIIDIGSSSSNIVGVIDGVYCFSRTIVTGGDEYSTALSRDLGVDPDRAENLKVNLNDHNTSAQVSKSLQRIHDSMAEEINSVLENFHRGLGVKLGGRDLDSVFLIGGGSRIPGLIETISKRCNVSVSLFDPFRKVGSSLSRAARRDLNSVKSFFGVSSGLGIRRVGD